VYADIADWSVLTNHARVLLCIAHGPSMRLHDIAARVGVTERTAYGIVTDLTEAGCVVKLRDGRRNRYQIQAHLPLPETDTRKRTIGEILALLTGADDEATA
jgi:DNA-binding IclR family transcriptional regulator